MGLLFRIGTSIPAGGCNPITNLGQASHQALTRSSQPAEAYGAITFESFQTSIGFRTTALIVPGADRHEPAGCQLLGRQRRQDDDVGKQRRCSGESARQRRERIEQIDSRAVGQRRVEQHEPVPLRGDLMQRLGGITRFIDLVNTAKREHCTDEPPRLGFSFDQKDWAAHR